MPLCDELLRLQHTASPEQFNAWSSGARAACLVRPQQESECPLTSSATTFQYFPQLWDQIIILSQRTWASLIGSNYLLTSHTAATVFLSVALSFLYNQEALTLSGTEDKAGMMTFVLLVIGFSSLSSMDLLISEKLLFCAERENGYYSTGAYYLVKLLFDFVPLRILPTATLGACIYYPLGLRVDGNSHFLWFLVLLVAYSIFVTGMCICVAIIAPTFGTAALVSALVILWYTVFGGLMIQSDSIPLYLRWFKYLSPSYYTYEALMVNELEGQKCIFNPATTEGSTAGISIPIECQQFLFNLGLDPRHFNFDVMMLGILAVVNVIIGFLLLLCIKSKH